MPPEAPGRYFIAKLRGREVAAVGHSLRMEGTWRTGPPTSAWTTPDETAAQVRAAGGRVLDEPFDPGGAVFCIWQPCRHVGAQLVNEPGAWNSSEPGYDPGDRGDVDAPDGPPGRGVLGEP